MVGFGAGDIIAGLAILVYHICSKDKGFDADDPMWAAIREREVRQAPSPSPSPSPHDLLTQALLHYFTSRFGFYGPVKVRVWAENAMDADVVLVKVGRVWLRTCISRYTMRHGEDALAYELEQMTRRLEHEIRHREGLSNELSRGVAEDYGH